MKESNMAIGLRGQILLFLFLAAALSYAIGFITGVSVFIVIGVIFELSTLRIDLKVGNCSYSI
jgi:hypothetical protein